MSINLKTATKKERNAEYKRIAKLSGDDRFFTRKEKNHLHTILQDNEPVLAFTSGLMNNNTWLIALTDRRIIFLDKGMLWGLKQCVIPLNRVNAVSGQTGIFFGAIAITDGAKTRTIKNVYKPSVVRFTTLCQEAIDKITNPPASKKELSPSVDLCGQLEKLGKLLCSGVLTQLEFEQAKAKLLAEI